MYIFRFPLFARSKDKLQFHYAVYLLNKNIAQLRWYCGLPTADLRATLPNLATLINIKPNQMQYVYFIIQYIRAYSYTLSYISILSLYFVMLFNVL